MLFLLVHHMRVLGYQNQPITVRVIVAAYVVKRHWSRDSARQDHL